jgi:hypothetical protein
LYGNKDDGDENDNVEETGEVDEEEPTYPFWPGRREYILGWSSENHTDTWDLANTLYVPTQTGPHIIYTYILHHKHAIDRRKMTQNKPWWWK